MLQARAGHTSHALFFVDSSLKQFQNYGELTAAIDCNNVLYKQGGLSHELLATSTAWRC